MARIRYIKPEIDNTWGSDILGMLADSWMPSTVRERYR